MKETKFKFLDANERRIIKQIKLVTKVRDSEFSVGYFFYERKVTKEYQLINLPEGEKDFKYQLEFPQQRIFPKDAIDNIIFQSVLQRFPNSKEWGYYIISTLDQDNIKYMSNRLTEIGEIVFNPSFANVDIERYINKQFTQLSTNITIFNDFKIEELKNLIFECAYDVRDEDILDKIHQVRFL